jgi:hypothetical protein
LDLVVGSNVYCRLGVSHLAYSLPRSVSDAERAERSSSGSSGFGR